MKKELIYAAVFGILILLLDVYLIKSYEEDWEVQINALYQIAGMEPEDMDNLQAVGKILKEEVDREQLERGRELLQSYGYDGMFDTVYDRKAGEYRKRISLVFAGIYLIFLFCILGIRKTAGKNNRKILQDISGILAGFKNQKYDVVQGEAMEGEAGELYSQLSSLGKQIKINEETMFLEKEGTKQLVTDISHQLKTPVAALKTCFSVLEEGDLKEEERREFFLRCKQQLKGLEELVKALVNVSRMETGMIEIKKEKKHIFDTMLLAVNSLYGKAEEKQIEMTFENEEGMEKLQLFHDTKWTKEAFINVLDNAIKYSEPGGMIKISMVKRNFFVRIEIKDWGIGIPKREYTQVFKRFFRGEGEQVKREEGSGVGLYLTREILERQGGSIAVHSKTGEKHGSTFVIQLPLEGAEG